MNRDIKCRAWDKRDNLMRNWNSLCAIRYGNNRITDKSIDDNLFNDPDFEMMQFTGLKDSNNKDIYEGDIVKALSSDNKYLSIVRWDDGDGRWAFQSLLSKSMSYCYNLTYGCSRWEIVGNIHENPELLDKDKN